MSHPAPVITPRKDLAKELKSVLGKDMLAVVHANDEDSIDVKRGAIDAVMIALRDRMAYQQLMEIAGVDYPDRAERFEVVYHLLSVTRNHRLRVRVTANEAIPVPSITGVWPNAGWLEREVFDMYGVLFSGNADLRRILTDYGFEGHPFRKDFPLTGYVEMRYSEEQKRVVYEPVKLAQDFRSFDFMSPWEGADYVLPGDEKAGGTGEAPGRGAPTPQSADKARKDTAPVKAAPPPTPKVTGYPADTGAGAATNKAAAKRSATTAKPRALRKPKGSDA